MADTVLLATANSNMLDRPLFLQAKDGDAEVPYTAADHRQLIQAIWPSEGVITTNAFKVTQNGSGDGTVNIDGGPAAITADGGTGLGSYLITSLGNVNVTVPTASSGVARTHRVVLEVIDSQLNASTDYTWQVRVIEGTSGSTAPATPGSAISIATIARTGSNPIVAANITDTRPFAGSSGALGEKGPWFLTTPPGNPGAATSDAGLSTVFNVVVPTVPGHYYNTSIDWLCYRQSSAYASTIGYLRIGGAAVRQTGELVISSAAGNATYQSLSKVGFKATGSSHTFTFLIRRFAGPAGVIFSDFQMSIVDVGTGTQ